MKFIYILSLAAAAVLAVPAPMSLEISVHAENGGVSHRNLISSKDDDDKICILPYQVCGFGTKPEYECCRPLKCIQMSPSPYWQCLYRGDEELKKQKKGKETTKSVSTKSLISNQDCQPGAICGRVGWDDDKEQKCCGDLVCTPLGFVKICIPKQEDQQAKKGVSSVKTPVAVKDEDEECVNQGSLCGWYGKQDYKCCGSSKCVPLNRGAMVCLVLPGDDDYFNSKKVGFFRQ
ncbi:hypothetical protein K440DRAFT_639755 [Wilcoxina mikolae CBS 423.85]|nr:hypothetical protein K440DRAFT_639755 [Wilcoxina mikolae CBS 423.85]